MKKMTKAQKLQAIHALLNSNAEMAQDLEFNAVEFLEREIELLNTRNSKRSTNRTLTKVQKENLQIVERISTFLEGNKGIAFSAKEVGEALELDFSSQKMTALMKKVVEEFGATKTQATSNKKLVGYGFMEEEANEEEEATEYQEA